MLAEPADVARVSLCKSVSFVAKLIFHNEASSRETVAERRLYENLLLSPAERFKKAFALMALAALFKKGPIKSPQGLGIILKKSASEPV